MGADLSELAEQVRTALDAGDIDGYQHLLAPDVHWGAADEPQWGCHNKRQVLNWYRAARDNGMSATIDEVLVGDDCLLVGMHVLRPDPDQPDADQTDADEHDAQPDGVAPRWQVLTVRNGLIVDIAGFDDRQQAAARAGVAR